MKKLYCLLSLALCFVASAVSAQVSPNQHEMMRQHGLDCHQRYDGCNNKALPQQRLPDEFWENKYGAMALNPATGGLGIAENENSRRSARELAIERCGGGSGCVIKGQVVNGCLAAGYTRQSGGGAYFGGSDTREAAIRDMQKNCTNGGHTCEVVHAGCSVPVRIR